MLFCYLVLELIERCGDVLFLDFDTLIRHRVYHAQTRLILTSNQTDISYSNIQCDRQEC